MTCYSTSLFIFRRDLRLQDNTALHEALRLSTQVIPCFIFDPRQVEPHPHQSKPGLQFMLQSIDDLQQQLREAGGKLALYHALPKQAVKQLAEQQQSLSRGKASFELRILSKITSAYDSHAERSPLYIRAWDTVILAGMPESRHMDVKV